MKTFFKNFGILLAILIAALSCSEEIWVHDGEDGKDGRDGYSVFIYYDESTGTLLYYHEIDGEEGLTSGDRVIYQETKENYKFVPVEGCIEIYKVVGTTEIFVGSICDGETGPPGAPGEAGIVVFSVVPDTVNCKSGFRVEMTSLEGGEEISSVSFCIPADGEDGTTVVQKDTIVVYDSVYVFNTDTIIRIDSIFVIGKDTIVETHEFMPLPDIQNDFNHPDNSRHYRDLGYIFEEGLVSINQHDSPEGNGTIVLHDYNRDYGYFWTPEFPEGAITAIELDVGSMENWVLKCSFELSDGSIKEVSSYEVKRKIDFIWYKTGTYGEPFKYYVALEDIEYNNVVRVRFSFYKENESWMLKDRNHSFNADNLRISRVKILK
jgi:hypothetical protein